MASQVETARAVSVSFRCPLREGEKVEGKRNKGRLMVTILASSLPELGGGNDARPSWYGFQKASSTPAEKGLAP